jgi:hypothetical protein
VNSGGRDPQIVGVGSVMEWVPQAAAGESKLGDGPEDGRSLERPWLPVSTDPDARAESRPTRQGRRIEVR